MPRPATPDSHHPAYRRDIDGLRAIAVLAVVLYHFGVPGLRGGFVGVDVFFVISGFLIGGILWREFTDTGTVRLRDFYIRRFRRLAPAFFVMALVTAALGWALLLPFEYREFGKTLIAATVYLSNVLFYRGSGYFDSASEDKPLLHTWSLAVEEQFYIFLPLLLVLLARRPRSIVPLLILTSTLSLALCVIVTPSSQTATFYLFPFRAWELLAGVLLAIWGQATGKTWEGHASLSWLGLALVVLSILLIPPGAGFPGALAMAPVLGTLLMLANGRGDNTVNRVLSSPGPVFFGLISYSLYLWHWPVLTLSDYLRGGYANLAEAGLWMALSVVLAWASWRFVERPVRLARRLPGALVLAGAALASVVLLAVGGTLYLRDGLPQRFGPRAALHIAASGDFLQDWSRCAVQASGPLQGLEVCAIGPEGPPRVLVWGDSHVRSYHTGLALAAEEAGVPGIILWRAGCPPLFDVRKIENSATAAQNLACANANVQIKQALPRLDSLRGLLLIGRWTYYATGQGIGLDDHNRIQVLPISGALEQDLDQAALVQERVRGTIEQLSPYFDDVAVLRQVPEIPFYDARLAAREAAHDGWPLAAAPVVRTDVTLAVARDRVAEAEAPFRDLAAGEQIDWIDPWPRLCEAESCSALSGEAGLYFDNNHMTNTGGLMLRDLMRPLFDRAGGDAEADAGSGAETGDP